MTPELVGGSDRNFNSDPVSGQFCLGRFEHFRFPHPSVRLATNLDREKRGKFGQETVKFCALSTTYVRQPVIPVKSPDLRAGSALCARRTIADTRPSVFPPASLRVQLPSELKNTNLVKFGKEIVKFSYPRIGHALCARRTIADTRPAVFPPVSLHVQLPSELKNTNLVKFGKEIVKFLPAVGTAGRRAAMSHQNLTTRKNAPPRSRNGPVFPSCGYGGHAKANARVHSCLPRPITDY